VKRAPPLDKHITESNLGNSFYLAILVIVSNLL